MPEKVMRGLLPLIRLQESQADGLELYKLIDLLQDMKAREEIPSPKGEAALKVSCGVGKIDLYVSQTELGWIGWGRSGQGIVSVRLPRQSRDQVVQELAEIWPEGILDQESPAEDAREIKEYIAGRRQGFSLPVDLQRAKPFQRAVLQATLTIPFGETRSYGWVARAIGAPRAARAVGHALATNPIPIIIPCHRVIASNGSLGGYTGGLPMKRKLLALEGVLQLV